MLWIYCGLAQADHAIALHVADSGGGIRANAYFWHEKPAKATIEQVAEPGAAARFGAVNQERMFDLKPQDNLWIRLDIERKASLSEHLILWIPLPLLDSVTLYQWVGAEETQAGLKPDAKGRWTSLRAGDRVPVVSWPEPGRYPRFHMELPLGKSTVYLKVQGSTPLSLPIHLGSEIHAQAADRQGFLGMGLMAGVLFTLVLVCMVTAYTYSDRLYLLYGFYMLVMILAVGSYTGIAAYLLWDQSPMWADAAQGALAILSAGGALYFIEAMLAGRQFAQRLSTFLLGLAAASIPLAVLYCFLPRSVGVIMMGVYMAVITTIGLTLAIRAWKRGDRVGKWIVIAYSPLALAVLLAVARAVGWITVSWLVQYGVVVALLIEAPMMMVALHARSRDRHEINTRESAMATQDALTGLLKEHIFDDRLKQTLARFTKRREDAAVVVISLVNYQAIVDAYGLPVAEQSVLRSVIKLRKVLRDVETVARVGTSQFGLILEGESRRERVTEIGARLIAQGLMPLPGLTPEITLHFHVAAVVLREMPKADPKTKQELLNVLSSMIRRTRRPIRFLEVLTSEGAALTAQTSAQGAADAVDTRGFASEQNEKMAYASTLYESSGADWENSGDNDPIAMGDTIPMTR